MTIRHHPSDETLTAYAAGSLDLGRRLVVASHVERCAACRGFVRGAEAIAGVMLEDLSPVPMSSDALSRTLARVDQKPGEAGSSTALSSNDADMPACLKPYEKGRWRWVGLGVEMRPILLPETETDQTRLFLLRAKPGTRLPQHSHQGTELTSILVGSFHHEGGDFFAGDFEEADDNVEHRPVVGSDSTCICLVALEGQLKLSGFIGALLNPFVRL